MKRLLLALVAVGLLASTASARCGRWRYSGYTLHNSYHWPSNCWQCHKKKKSVAAYNWREAMTTIEKQKIETSAFLQALQTISPQQQAQGYAAGYGATYQGEMSSYPVQGNSLYGVQAYSSNPLIDLNAAFATQAKLAGQLSAGAHSSASDAADLTSLAYQLESDRQAKIAAFSAVQAIAQGNPPQPQATQFRFKAEIGPSGQVVIHPESPQPSVTAPADALPSGAVDGLAVLEQRCASCHSAGGREGIKGGFDLAKLGGLDAAAWDEICRRIDLPPEDPDAMPQGIGDDGSYGPGRPLDWREKAAIRELALRAK
jgi:hypothetical protein